MSIASFICFCGIFALGALAGWAITVSRVPSKPEPEHADNDPVAEAVAALMAERTNYGAYSVTSIMASEYLEAIRREYPRLRDREREAE